MRKKFRKEGVCQKGKQRTRKGIVIALKTEVLSKISTRLTIRMVFCVTSFLNCSGTCSISVQTAAKKKNTPRLEGFQTTKFTSPMLNAELLPTEYKHGFDKNPLLD